MPNFLDKITNTMTQYVADAKNIKGTYVVVNDYSELASLPEATVVNGTLAYCVNDYYNPLIPEEISNKLGFYQYDGSNWNIIHLGPIKIVLDKYDSSNFDITETYTWTGVDLYSILTDLLGITQNGGLIQIDFNDLSILFNYQGIADANNSVCSIILIYNNQQYIATLTSSSTGLTLSFQELQAGSGGGGTGITKTKYNIEVEDSNNNKAIIPISKEAFDNYLVEMNQVGQTLATALGITWTTINDIDGLKDTFDDLKTGQLAYGCDLAMNLLVKYAYESGENPVCEVQVPLLTNKQIFAINNVVTYELSSNILGAIISIDSEVSDVVTQATKVWFKSEPTYQSAEISIDQSATFTYTTETETYGGGGESTQPTEEFRRFKLHTSEIKVWTDPQEVGEDITETLHQYYTFIIPKKYDEQLLGYANELLQESFTSIDELFTYLNTAITSSGSDAVLMVIMYKQMITTLSKLTPFKIELNYDYKDGYEWPVEEYFNNALTIQLDTMTLKAYAEFDPSTNVANSIKFLPDKIYQVEYEDYNFGGSSSGGGTAQTKKWYTFSITDTLDSPLSISNLSQIDTAEMFVEITDEQWSDFKTDVLSNVPSLSSIQTPQDFVDLYNNSIPGVGGGDSILALLVPYLVDYAMSNQSRCELLLTVNGGDGITLYPTSNIKGFGGTLATSFGGTVYNWFDYITGSANSSMGVTEETETIGGGSVTPQPSSDSGIDFLKIFAVGNARNLIVTLPKGYLNESAQVTTLNTLISTLNTNFSLSIPSYTNIDDFTNIATYLTTLPNSSPYNILAKVIFYSNMFWYMNAIALSVKIQLIDGSKLIVQSPVIEALADSQNQQFSYDVKYLDDSLGGLSLETVWSSGSPQETYDFVIYANDIEASPFS